MHVISKRPFNDAARKHPNQREALMHLYRELERTHFKSSEEMKAVFSSLDNFKYKKGWWVLDIGGNHLRLIACIQFKAGRMYIKHICTHPEYDKLCERYRKGEL